MSTNYTGFFSASVPKLKAEETKTQAIFPINSSKISQKLKKPESFKKLSPLKLSKNQSIFHTDLNLITPSVEIK